MDLSGSMLVFKCFLAHSSTQGSEERDVAFMERLRCLAREALSWAWLTPQQRLVWAAAIELDAVPLQERFGTGERPWPCKSKGSLKT